MTVRKTMLLAVGLVSLIYAQRAHALLEGKLDEGETKQAIEKVISDRQFAIEQAKEREMMRKKNNEAFDVRMQELRIDSPPEAMAHSPGVKAASAEDEQVSNTGRSLIGLVMTGLGLLFILVLAGLVWRQTMQDKANRAARKLKLKQSIR